MSGKQKEKENGNKVKLSEIKKLIPPHCFEKKLLNSLFYMIVDMILLSSSFYTWQFVERYYFIFYIPFVICYGFIMWCLFVVGHDCGHGSFSNHSIINDICGHLCQVPLCVPYWPWAYSHSQHHKYHNHYEKDLSHKWNTQNDWQTEM
eukprot:UN02137